jgi:hypothetical protein
MERTVLPSFVSHAADAEARRDPISLRILPLQLRELSPLPRAHAQCPIARATLRPYRRHEDIMTITLNNDY